MILNITNYFFGHNRRLCSGEEDNKWIEKQAYKNYSNQNVEKKVRKIWCTPYKSNWMTPNDLVHIKLKIEKTEKWDKIFIRLKIRLKCFKIIEKQKRNTQKLWNPKT